MDCMRVISLKTLQKFWSKNHDAKQHLLSWHDEVSQAHWKNPEEIKERYTTASILKNRRVVFNIKGNQYRLIVGVAYEFGSVFIKFVGTHDQYSQVDAETVESMILKTIKAFKLNTALDLLPITANWDEDRIFILDLFNKTIQNEIAFNELIANKTQNWDVERIAMVDTILMKMAITEFVHFQSIPTKVTMNEYIDISKEFSTPKSKGFINGILDKILIDLKENNQINKSGRGLVN